MNVPDSQSTALTGRRAFVTGGNGFIGRRLVRALDQAGAEVTILCRSDRGTTARHAASVRTIVGELSNRRRLANALRDQEVVFHLAYEGHASAAENLEAFESLLSGCADARVSRIVHTSSIVVYDDWPDGDLDESGSMSRPGGSGYRQAKIEMERRLMRGTIPAAVLQPTLVYGAGSAFWTDQFLEWLALGDIVLPTPEGHCCGVFVDDVVQALIRAAILPGLGQERFIISGQDSFSWSSLLEGYARIVGSGTVKHVAVEELESRLGPQGSEHSEGGSSGAAAVYAVGRRLLGRERFERLVRWAKRRLAKDGTMYPDAHLLELFSATGRCDIERARTRLAYEPEFDLTRGLAATASELRAA